MAHRAADAQLIELLHDEHAAAVYGFCLRWTADAQLAQDAVQEVFLRAWKHLPRLDVHHKPVRPWLLAVARNVVTDMHRSQQRRPPTVADDCAMARVAAPDELDGVLETWLVAEALQRLTPEHREVLVQAHWLGRSVAETAAALDIPPGTVKSRTYYALRALRAALDEMGVER